MPHHLSTEQRAKLRKALKARQRELDSRFASHTDGGNRAEHAHEVLQQDGDDAPQRDADREVDFALTDRNLQELGAVSLALKRVQDDEHYGQCIDCSEGIAFARLELEPWALRCVACESKREQASGGARPPPKL